MVILDALSWVKCISHEEPVWDPFTPGLMTHDIPVSGHSASVLLGSTLSRWIDMGLLSLECTTSIIIDFYSVKIINFANDCHYEIGYSEI